MRGKIRIRNGDDSTFIAERADAPIEPIPHPPSYRDKRRRRKWYTGPMGRAIERTGTR